LVRKAKSHEWQAQWIWGKAPLAQKNRYQAFRKTFSLPHAISHASLYITADTRYVVFLNGERLGQGPVRSWPFDLKYDVYDITSRLCPGENTISVLVHSLGMSTFQYIHGQGGLLCQVNAYDNHGRTLVLAETDETWRTILHPGYQQKTPRICCQLGYEEQFDANYDLRQDAISWLDREYLDDGWESPQVIGPVGTPPWSNLSERDIPFLTEEPIYPHSVLSVRKVKPVPYRFSLDMVPLFCPGKTDANRTDLHGALVMNMRAPEDVMATWHKFQVYGYGGRVQVNGQPLEFDHSMAAPISLRQGDNLVVIDVTGEWHDLFFTFAVDSDVTLEFTAPCVNHTLEGPSLGFIIDEDGQDLTSRLWATASVRELMANKMLQNAIQLIPTSALMDSVFACTTRRKVEPGSVVIDRIGNLLASNGQEAVIYPTTDGSDIEILLDFGRELVGFLQFRLHAHQGVTLDWNCFEGIQEGRWLFTDGLNNTLRYITRAGHQSFHSHIRRGFRYAALTIRGLKEPLRLGQVRCLLNTYPIGNRAQFQCSDYLLNSIWQLARYTSRLCSEDTYVDCPAYEQAFWVGDARNEALVDYYVSGDYRLAKRSLRLVAQSLERSPLPESQVPSGWQNILTAWSLLWILACQEHYIYSGDKEFAQDIYPALRQTCLSFINGYINDDDLLDIKAWNMLDWAPMDTPDEGVVTHQNAWLVKALRQVAQLAKDLSVPTCQEDAALFEEYAQRIKVAINKHLWSSKHQAFVDSLHADGTLSEVVSQQTNTIVYLCDCANEDHLPFVARYVKEVPTDWVSIGSPFMMFFSFEALVKQGSFQEILEWTRHYWGLMLDSGATTCWETFPGFQKDRWTRSHCHAWSAAPGYFLPAYQLGVRPLEPGFASVLIQPETAGLSWCKGVVPSPKGDITVYWQQAKRFTIEVKLPPEVTGLIRLPDYTHDPEIITGKADIIQETDGHWQAEAVGGQAVVIRAEIREA